ncbi:MAG TPA: polysaccharide biosynthesis C-terminal domain-containing protein [Nitrospira sp.]|nr:polysaccharide biosynthesis C-terminal domain-containing protein [Nitrospira sp.]
MSIRSITKGIVSVGMWSATKLVVTGFVLPIYSRMLGTDGYGQYAYYVALLLIASHPAGFGMRHTLTKYFAERPNERAWQRQLAGFARSVMMGSGLIVGASVLALLISSSGVELHALGIAAIVVGILWCDQMHQYASGILYGLHREEDATVPAALGVVIGGAIGAVLAVAGFGVMGALSGLLIAGALVAGVTLRQARRAIGVTDSAATVPLPRGELFAFGMSTMAYAGVAMTLYSVDVVLVRYFAGDQQTGLYAAAVQWSEFVWFVPIAIEGVMLQSTAGWWAQGKIEEITRLVSRLMRYVAVTTAFLLIYVLVFAEHIVTFYFGPQFRDATFPLQLLVPGAFAFSLARVIRPVIQAHGWVMTLLKTVSAATVVNVMLNVVLVPRWGATGAAVATSLSFICVTLLYVRLLQGEGVHAFQGFAAGRLLLLCAGTVAVLVPIALTVSEPLLAITVGGLTALCLYWCGVFWLGLIRVRELERIVESMPGPLRQAGIKAMRLLQPMLMRLDAIAMS